MRLTPSSAAPDTSVISSAVAIRVLLGTQSVRTADPPSPSESTMVTSAPSWAATSPDSYPPAHPHDHDAGGGEAMRVIVSGSTSAVGRRAGITS